MRRCTVPESPLATRTPIVVARAVPERERDGLATAVRRWASATVGVVATGALMLAPPAYSEIERFPASGNPEVFAVQKTLVEAWEIVNDVFVDPTGEAWHQDLRTHLLEAYKADDADGAYNSISAMLKDLDDPYTRLVLPE